MIDIDQSAAEDRPLTLPDVVQLVQLHPKAVVEYVRRGELVGQQIGRRWTFSQAAVDAFLEPMPDWTFEVQFRGMNGEIESRVAPEIPQPSAKTLKAVEKLVSYMKAKAAKNTPDPKEPTGTRARSDAGRFVGVRVNEDEVPRLPIFPAQWALDDPRQRPYLVVWGRGAYAIKMTPAEGGNAVVVTLTSGESYRIPILRRVLSRGGTALFYLCPWCRKPRRFLYLQTLSGDDLVEYLGPRCLRCAGLRFASQGRYRTKLTREFAPILGPRPRRPRDPWAVSDPRIAEKATDDRPPRGEGSEVSDDAEDPDDIDLDEDEETRPYPGRPPAPKLARPRPGAGAGELSDEASALIERFAKGLTGQLSSPIQNGTRYESPFPYLKIALDWEI